MWLDLKKFKHIRKNVDSYIQEILEILANPLYAPKQPLGW